MRAGALVDRLVKRSEGLGEFDRRHQVRVNLSFKMRQLGLACWARAGGANLPVSRSVGYNGIGESFHPDLVAGLAMGLFLRIREVLVGAEDAAVRRLVVEFLEARFTAPPTMV